MDAEKVVSDWCPGCTKKCAECTKPLPVEEYDFRTTLNAMRKDIAQLQKTIEAHERRIDWLESTIEEWSAGQ